MKMQWKESTHTKPHAKGFYLCYSSFEIAPSVRHFDGVHWEYSISECEVEDVLCRAMEFVGRKDEELIEAVCNVLEDCFDVSSEPDYWIELPDMLDIDKELTEIDVEVASAAATAADMVAQRVRSILLQSTQQKAPWKP